MQYIHNVHRHLAFDYNNIFCASFICLLDDLVELVNTNLLICDSINNWIYIFLSLYAMKHRHVLFLLYFFPVIYVYMSTDFSKSHLFFG